MAGEKLEKCGGAQQTRNSRNEHNIRLLFLVHPIFFHFIIALVVVKIKTLKECMSVCVYVYVLLKDSGMENILLIVQS